jgi:dihydrofolate reductase
MSRLIVNSFSVSADGYGAGPAQSLADPLGVGGMALHDWAFATRTFRSVHGDGEGETGVDDGFAVRGFANMGGWILGRNMFGPERGEWSDPSWRGWWGDDPPYHCPVFVLTHHARASIEMAGGTTFHFVTDGLEVAIARAREAAGGKDVRLGGGVSTLRQGFLRGLVDEAHIAIAPVLLGGGEPLWAGLDLPALGYRVAEAAQGERAQHLVLRRGA